MSTSSLAVAANCIVKPKPNWPIVSLLMFLTAVPGLPAIFILMSIAIGPPDDGSAHSFVNMLHFLNPMPVIVHGGAGIVFFLTMPFQFSSALRTKHKNWHRFAGHMTIISGYVIACSAPWMHQVFSPDSGLPRFSGLLAMSACMIVAFSLALGYVLRRNIQQHRAWMIRAIAITLGPITSALITILISTVYGNLDNFYPGLSQFEFEYSRWFGMVMNLMIVEYVLFKERTAQPAMATRVGVENN